MYIEAGFKFQMKSQEVVIPDTRPPRSGIEPDREILQMKSFNEIFGGIHKFQRGFHHKVANWPIMLILELKFEF